MLTFSLDSKDQFDSPTSAETIPPHNCGVLGNLPPEIVQYRLVPFLGAGPLVTGLGSTCKHFRAVCTSDEVMGPYAKLLFHLDTVPESDLFNSYVYRMNEIRQLSKQFWENKVMRTARCCYLIIVTPIMTLSVVLLVGFIASTVLVGFGVNMSRLTIRIVGLVFAIPLLLLILISSLQCCLGIEIWQCIASNWLKILQRVIPKDQMKLYREEQYREGKEVDVLVGEREPGTELEEFEERPRKYIRRVVLDGEPQPKEALTVGMNLRRRDKWKYRLLSSSERLQWTGEGGSYADTVKRQLLIGVLTLLPLAVVVALCYTVIRTFDTRIGFGAAFFSTVFVLHFVVMSIVFAKSCIFLSCGCSARVSCCECCCWSQDGDTFGAYVTEGVCVGGLILVFIPLSLVVEGVIGTIYVPLILLVIWIASCALPIVFVVMGYFLINDLCVVLFKHQWLCVVIPIMVIVCSGCWVIFFVLFVLFYVGVIPASPFFAFIPAFVVLCVILLAVNGYSCGLCHHMASSFQPPEMRLIEIAERVEGEEEGELFVRRTPEAVPTKQVTIL